MTFLAKSLSQFSLRLLLLLGIGILPCHGKLPIDAVLKTEIADDPYANDGLSFRALCYHDTRDNLRESFKTWPERGALETATLIEQFEWLRENGYHMVSLDDILAARNGGPKLPSKAILLSFDDGYLSMYTRVFPLLKLFHYPAVIGLVGEWLKDTKDGKVFYGDRLLSRNNFVTWPHVREMVASGLVEVASHSHSLHKGARSNPQGSLPSAAITRIYNPVTKHYETDEEYIARIRSDLATNSKLIERETGKKPRTMIWPYGAYNMLGVEAAKAEGMPISMTLEAGSNTPDQPLTRIRRNMLVYHDKISDLKSELVQPANYDGHEQPLTRVVGIDLDKIYDPNPVQQDKNVGKLIDRIKQLQINAVYIKAVADLDHDGKADVAYFPNRHLPLRTDLFNRVAWQLHTRAAMTLESLHVYTWLPIMAYETRSGNPLNQQVIKEIFEDAAKNSPRVGGLLLGDVNDTNDLENHEHLTFTKELISVFKIHHPYAFVARFLAFSAGEDGNGLINNQSSFSSFVKHYDFVTLSVQQKAHIIEHTNRALEGILDAFTLIPNMLNTTVFLLNSTNDENSISSEELAIQLRLLQQNGARNIGYYTQQLIQDQPKFAVVYPAISLQSNPGKKP